MGSSASPLTARATIALGTLVEVALPHDEATESRFRAAFSIVSHVHARMSPHAVDGDVARIAHEAHRRAIRVDAHTYAVLELALAMSADSRGVFDPTTPQSRGRMQAIVLLPRLRVRASEAVSVDLGGIAKGYAVDCAVAALREAGASAGIVNAGGDLRVFGDSHWHAVRVRHPAKPTLTRPLCELRNQALATSAAYFGETAVDRRTRRTHRLRHSVTVVAPTCAVADALTKVVALAPADAPRLLERYNAQAIVLEANGEAASAGAVAADRLRMAA
ncbi:MAG TPA: FAD:protein FMN transferase [Casimicrobiaceae bacterium]|nr:FAD:protein FMN transferase [Casimicrobiaceae bacterium]